jgi:hypothetical protein
MTDRYKQIIVRISDEIYEDIREAMFGSRLTVEEYVRDYMLYDQLASDESEAMLHDGWKCAEDGGAHWRYYNRTKGNGFDIVAGYVE